MCLPSPTRRCQLRRKWGTSDCRMDERSDYDVVTGPRSIDLPVLAEAEFSIRRNLHHSGPWFRSSFRSSALDARLTGG